MDCKKEIVEYFNKIKLSLDHIDTEQIIKAVELLNSVESRKGTVYVFGNGGSSSTASHIQNDMNKSISEHCTKKFNVVCLSDNVATITAIANDHSYDEIFSFQLEGRLNPEDAIIAISGSGNSENVVRAVEYARNLNIPVISMTGFDGGRLLPLSDIKLHVAIDDIQVAEDCHLIFNHLLSRLLKI